MRMAKRNISGTVLEIFIILYLIGRFSFYALRVFNSGMIPQLTSRVLQLFSYVSTIMLLAATIVSLLVIVVIPTKHTFRRAVQALIFFDVFRQE